MKKIRKDNIIEGKIKNNFKTFLGISAICILIGFEIWLKTENRMLSLIITTALIFVVFSIFVIENVLEKKTSHLRVPYYIVEDVFIHVNSQQIVRINRPNYIIYSLKFSRNGVYKFFSFKYRKEPNDPDADYSAVHFSKPGDKVFLAISERTGEVVKCYNQNYYSLCEEDFDYIDGKYYPKKHSS